MSAPDGIPEAWPMMLNKAQAANYVGLSEGSFDKICPVPPIDYGISVLRWNRLQLEAWVAGLPSRLRGGKKVEQIETGVMPPAMPEIERRQSALERARARAEQACRKKSRTSKGSSVRAVG